MTRFELDIEPHSYGFRLRKNLQQAVLQSLAYINDDYQDIVDIDSYRIEYRKPILKQL